MTEHSNSPDNEKTYFIDSQSAAEMARLMDFDRYLTKAMGGPMEERTEYSNIHRILDIACGPGGWVLDLAFEHPEIDMFGIEIFVVCKRLLLQTTKISITRFRLSCDNWS